MTPYNVMTNLETSDTGVTVVNTYSYYQVLYQYIDTLTIVKNGKALHKVMLKYNVYDRYTTVDTITAAVTLFNFIGYAITHPVDAVVAFSSSPIIGSRTDTLYRVLCIYETAGIRVMSHKYISIHDIRCGISAYLVNAAYETNQGTHRYEMNILNAMSGIEVEVIDVNGSISELSHWTQPTDTVFDSIPTLAKRSRDGNKRTLTKEEYVHPMYQRVFGYKAASAIFIDEFFGHIINEK